MTGLLDTHTFLWWANEPSRLSAAASAFLKSRAKELLLSVVSAWEIQIKLQAGKLSLLVPLQDLLSKHQANGIRILPMMLAHVLALEALPMPHKDPFDRLLIAQAMTEQAAIVSADAVFTQHTVQVIW